MLNSSDASESFWLTFSNSKNEMVKIGLNQFESYRVSSLHVNSFSSTSTSSYIGRALWRKWHLPDWQPDPALGQLHGARDQQHHLDLQFWHWVSFEWISKGMLYLDAIIAFSWTYLPPNVHFFQMVHAHFNLTNSLLEPADSREFFGTICSGFDSGTITHPWVPIYQVHQPIPLASELMEIDWRGCEMDSRTITNLDSNSQYSEVWLQFVDVPEVTTTTPKSTTQVLTTNASSFKLFPSVFMSFLVLIMSLVAMSWSSVWW